MKNKLIYYLCFLLSFTFIISCEKDRGTNDDLKVSTEYRRAAITPTRTSCEFDLDRMDRKDKNKVLLSRFIGTSIRDVGFRDYILRQLYNPIRGRGGSGIESATEFLILDHMDDQIAMGTGTTVTFEDLLEDWIDDVYEEQVDLGNLCEDFLDVVIDLPWWAEHIIETEGGINNFAFGSIPEVEPMDCNGEMGWVMTHEHGTQFVLEQNPIQTYLPIYVKTTEEYIVFNELTDLTNTNQLLDDVIAMHFSYNPDCEVTRSELTEFMKTVDCDNITFLDVLSLISFIESNCPPPPPPPPPPTEICDNGIDDNGDGLIDGNDPLCPCEIACGRDCTKEQNTMEGLRFAGPYMYNHINQQFSEAITHLNYTFLGVDVCDPQTNGAPCPSNSVNNSIIDLIKPVDEFFLMQKFSIRSDDEDSTWPVVGTDGVVFIKKREGQGFCDKCWYDYWKAWPKYFDTSVPYLTNFQRHWNGDLLGDKIKFILLEKDNVTVTTTYTTSLSVNVSTNMTQGGSPQGENNGTAGSTSYSFSTGISNTTSFSQNNRYLKDIELGEYNLFYCDEVEDLPDPAGEPFTWTGHIPNNYNGVPVYHHFYYQ